MSDEGGFARRDVLQAAGVTGLRSRLEAGAVELAAERSLSVLEWVYGSQKTIAGLKGQTARYLRLGHVSWKRRKILLATSQLKKYLELKRSLSALFCCCSWRKEVLGRPNKLWY